MIKGSHVELVTKVCKAKFQFMICAFYECQTPAQQIADLQEAIDAQKRMRSILGDLAAEITPAVLHDQLNEFERQASQQDAANWTIAIRCQSCLSVSPIDIEAGLERGTSLDLNKTVLMALGG